MLGVNALPPVQENAAVFCALTDLAHNSWPLVCGDQPTIFGCSICHSSFRAADKTAMTLAPEWAASLLGAGQARLWLVVLP